MTAYYVRKTGSDSNNGLSPATAWATIAKALTTAGGIASGDVVYIGAGTYRESVTGDIDFTSMTLVVGDVSGKHTGDPGEVIWSAWTTSDVAAPSGWCFVATATRNIQFEDITFHCGNSGGVTHQEDADPYNLVFLRCNFIGGHNSPRAINIEQTTAHACNVYIDRCRFFMGKIRHLWNGVAGGADWDANVVVMSSFILAGDTSDDGAISSARNVSNTFKAGGLKVVNCTIISGGQCVFIKNDSSTTIKGKIFNNVLMGLSAGVAVLQSHSTSAQDEDYNLVVGTTPRTNVTAGSNSISSVNQNLGLIDVGQAFGIGAQMKHLGQLVAGNPGLTLGRSLLGGAAVDLFGVPTMRSGSSSPAVGAMQPRNVAQREQSVFHSGSNSLKIVGPGYHDFQTVVDAASTTLGIWARYNSDYNPALTAVGAYHGRPLEVSGIHRSVAVHPSGKYVAIAHDSSPYVSVYTADPDIPGLGRRLIAPATLPAGDGNDVAWSPDGAHLVVAHDSSPFVTAYSFDQEHGIIGAKLSNPGTLPAGTGNAVAFSPSGAYLAVAHNTSPYVSVYPWSSGFGSKVANPATLPVDQGNGVAWTSTSDYLAVAHNTAPCVSVYPFSTGFGAKLSDPATQPANNGRGVHFSPDDAYLAVTGNVSPFIYAYPFTKGGGGSIGTKIANPGTLPSFSCRDVKFSPAGDYIALASGDTPFIVVYPWTGSFGSKLTNPGTLPGNECFLAWTEGGASILYPGGPGGFVVGYRMKSRLPAFEVLNGEECGVSPQADVMTSAQDTWEQLTLTFTPTSKGIVTVRIHSRAKDGNGIAYFDDFSAS